MVRSGGAEWRTVMTTPNLPAIILPRRAWNRGRIIGQKRPLQPKHVWAIRVRLELAENIRDLALFNLAIDSKLRGCDLVRLIVSDVNGANLRVICMGYLVLIYGLDGMIGHAKSDPIIPRFSPLNIATQAAF